jgi:uncharacterized protein with PIN domain
MLAPQFIADAMLGRLSRKLRMLGYDTLYFRKIDENTLLKRAFEEGRQILTRKIHLINRKESRCNTFFIKDNDPSKQLMEVLEYYKLTINPLTIGTRCLRCNKKLKSIPLDQVASQVPDYVISTQKHFSTCPRCNKIYWKGTHYENMVKTVKRLKGEPSVKPYNN